MYQHDRWLKRVEAAEADKTSDLAAKYSKWSQLVQRGPVHPPSISSKPNDYIMIEQF